MSQIANKRFYYINSNNGVPNGISTWTNQIQTNDSDRFNRIVLLSASIPISYYIVQSGFNTFTLTENGVHTIITIPAGNYNANSFAIILSGILNTSSPNHLTYIITFPISFTSNNTGLYTYNVNSSAISVSFSFSSNNDLNEQLGFVRGSMVSFTPGIGSSTLLSSNVIKFIPEDSLFIHCNAVNEPGNDVSSDILETIYFGNNTVFANNSYICPDPMAYSRRISSLSKSITFSITNESGLPLTFNGLNINMTIMVYRDLDYYVESLKIARLTLMSLHDIEEEEKKVVPDREFFEPLTDTHTAHTTHDKALSNEEEFSSIKSNTPPSPDESTNSITPSEASGLNLR